LVAHFENFVTYGAAMHGTTNFATGRFDGFQALKKLAK
jgi:hypothetical protein